MKIIIPMHAEAAAPSGVNFTHDGTTITVTWTPPSPAPSNGYIVYYADFYSYAYSARDAGNVSVSSGSTSQVVIPVTNIVYRVSVVAVSDLPSVQTEAVPGRHIMCYHYSNSASVPVTLLHASLQIPILSYWVKCCCQTTVSWITLSCVYAV